MELESLRSKRNAQTPNPTRSSLVYAHSGNECVNRWSTGGLKPEEDCGEKERARRQWDHLTKTADLVPFFYYP